jgi:L-alanine-DL-glutamate epimerase-like enolase superfamily enzyme
LTLTDVNVKYITVYLTIAGHITGHASRSLRDPHDTRSSMRTVTLHTEIWAAARPFRIAGREKTAFTAVVCTIEEDGLVGRGQASGVAYQGETAESISAQLELVREALQSGASRHDLLTLLPAGGARCAADAALWDLESQIRNQSAWTIAGTKPEPVETAYTVGIEDTPELMAERAAAVPELRLLKIKLDRQQPAERLLAIRAVRPDARILVDANQSWTMELLRRVMPVLQQTGVLLVEQPLPRGADEELEQFESPIPFCADESCLDLPELDVVARRYQLINIKLDKCGGLTRGLELATAVRARGLGLMVGCMGHNSLSMAPAHVLAQFCDFADLDGPLLLRNDMVGGLIYRNGLVSLPKKRFWGEP